MIKKLLHSLPVCPRSRHNIFSGTNTWREWRMIFSQWFRGADYKNEKIITRYEKEFAKTIGVKYASSFGAGRMALFAALDALEIGVGDEVILPAYTCVVVPNAILYCGATPVYVDIEKDTQNINADLIEQAITNKTKAILAQHTFGLPCDLQRIMAIAGKHNIKVIEDCAHSAGAVYSGKKVGGIADVGFFSTDHTKIMSTFLGGMVTTNNADIADKVRKLQLKTPFLPISDHKKLLRSFLLEYPLTLPVNYWWGKFVLTILGRLGLMFFWRDEHLVNKPSEYAYPARLSAQQALLGLSQLSLLAANLEHRRRASVEIQQLLQLPQAQGNLDNSACLRFSFYVQDRERFESVFAFRWELGIWFTSIAQGRNENLEEIQYTPGQCPVAEYAAKHLVNYPTHPGTSHKFIASQINKHITFIKESISESSNS